MSGLIDYGWLSDVEWPENLNPNAPFNLTEIQRLVWQYGIRALWEIATKCPCGSAGNPSPRTDCPVCHGKGWEFHHPQIVRIIAIGFGRSLDPFQRWGTWEPGQVSLTVRAEHCPGPMDRITWLDARMPMNDLFIRAAPVGGTTRETLRYPIVPKTYMKGSDLTTGSLDVVYLRAAGADGLAGPVLVQGDDYVIDWTALPTAYEAAPNGAIDWRLGDAKDPQTTPPLDGLFSLYYYTRPVFRVMGNPHTVRDTRVNSKSPDEEPQSLPVQFTAKLELAMEGA